MKRQNISKRVRFSVFSRDGFACKYCGKQSDQVCLVIDHILPVAKGGTNDETNLITACEPCNQGKSDIPLPTSGQIESHRLGLAQEFQEQNSLHRKAVVAAKLKRKVRQTICNKYCEVFSVSDMLKNTLSHYVNLCAEFGPDLLFEWFQIAASKPQLRKEVDIVKYIHGIKRRYREETNAPTIS